MAVAVAVVVASRFALVSATMRSAFATFYDGEADGSCDGPWSGGEVTTPYTCHSVWQVLALQVAIPAWSFLTTTTTTTTTATLKDLKTTTTTSYEDYYLGSLSWTSKTFYFPDSRDLLEVLRDFPSGIPIQAQAEFWDLATGLKHERQ